MKSGTRLLFKPASVLFALSILLFSCEKNEIPETAEPVIPIEPVAAFSIPANELPCALPQQYPIYHPGEVLDANDTVQLNIKVSRKGKWSISTDTVNGIAFAGSGTFTDTGIFKIELSGWGKPAIVGTFNLKAKLNDQVKFIPMAVVDPAVLTETIPQQSYFRGKLGQDSIIINPRPYNAPYSPNSQDRARYMSEISNWATNDILAPREQSIEIIKGIMYNHKNSTEADFKNFFAPGSYPLLLVPCQDVYGTDAVGIFYGDYEQDELWFSAYYDANQLGSSFTITGLEDGHDRGIYFVKIKAKINCQMFNPQTRELRQLNGEMVCYFTRQQVR